MLNTREYSHIIDNNSLSFNEIREMLTNMFENKIELQERHLSDQVVIENSKIRNLEEISDKYPINKLQEYFSKIPGEYSVSFDFLGENDLIPYSSKGFFLDNFRSSGDPNILNQIKEDIKQGVLENTFLASPASFINEDNSYLQMCLADLQEINNSIYESPNLTLRDLVKSKFQSLVRESFDVEENQLSGITNSLCNGVPLHKSLLSLKNYKQLQEIFDNRKQYIAEFKQPIKESIDRFANRLTKLVKSPLLPEDVNLNRRLFKYAKQISDIVENIKDDRYSEFIQDAINLTEEDISPVGGLSFKYKDNIYNLNSKLETVKNISRLFKEGNDIVPPVRFSIKSEGQKRIALFPGSFKPPHKGHYAVAEQLARTNGIDEVRILISPLPRSNSAGTNTITAEQSLNVWKVMAEQYKNIKPQISKSNSPVTAIYEALREAKQHENFILTVGDKDSSARFSSVDSFLKENNPSIKAEVYTSRASGENRNLSATQLREMIASENKDGFYSFMPDSLERSRMNEIWTILTTVNENSAMAAGNVEGGGIKKKKNTLFVERNKLMEEILQDAIIIAPRRFLKEAVDNDAAPHASTGINVLRDLLKKIVPQIEQDFKTLTTSKEQRDSFRAHLLKALDQSLNRSDMTSNASGQEMEGDPMISEPPTSEMKAIAEQILNNFNKNINIDEWVKKLAEDISRSALMDEADLEMKVEEPPSEEDGQKFIDIDDKKKSKEEIEKEKQDAFTIPGKDLTGRNMAQSTFDSIENTVLDSFIILSNDEDKALFKDYLMANLKLYFDRFEQEMASSTSEPETGDAEMQNTTPSADSGGMGMNTGADQEASFGGI